MKESAGAPRKLPVSGILFRPSLGTDAPVLARDPLSGLLFVFFNQRASQVKVLYWDRTGFCLWAKRLEAGRFVSDWSKASTRETDWTSLKLLLDGIEPGRVRKRHRVPEIPGNSLESAFKHVGKAQHLQKRRGIYYSCRCRLVRA